MPAAFIYQVQTECCSLMLRLVPSILYAAEKRKKMAKQWQQQNCMEFIWNVFLLCKTEYHSQYLEIHSHNHGTTKQLKGLLVGTMCLFCSVCTL